MKKTYLYRVPRLILGVFVFMLIGIVYAWSILKFPFEVMWEPGLLGFTFTLTLLFFYLGVFFSGALSKVLSPTVRLIISAVTLFLGYFLSAFVIYSGNIIVLFFAYGILCGTGIGFAYNTVLSSVNAWFPDKIGLSSGLMISGFGFSTMIFGRMLDAMGTSDLFGWFNTYIIIAIVFGVVLFIASFIIKPPPESVVLPKGKIRKSEQFGDFDNLSALEVMKRFSFIKIAVIAFALTVVGNGAVGFAKDIALDVGATPGFAVMAVGFLSVANGLFRPIVGWLYDNIGLRKTQYVVSFMVVLAPLMIIFALITNSLALGVVGLCLCGIALGMAPTTSSVFLARFYGLKNFSRNFGFLNLLQILAPFSATLTGVLNDRTGGFVLAFVFIAGIGLIGAIVNLTIKKP